MASDNTELTDLQRENTKKWQTPPDSGRSFHFQQAAAAGEEPIRHTHHCAHLLPPQAGEKVKEGVSSLQRGSVTGHKLVVATVGITSAAAVAAVRLSAREGRKIARPPPKDEQQSVPELM